MPQDQFQGRKFGWRRPMRARLMYAAGGAALTALVVCAGGAARAGDDNDNVSSSKSIYDHLLEVVGVNGGANIQYGERSPLVVPPTRDLPPPQANVPPPVADWPHDPDIARRTQAKAKEKPQPHPDWASEFDRPLRPDELRASGAPSGGGGTATADVDSGVPRPKKSIFDFSFWRKEQYATFTGEPARTSLTDPPPGYQTPSPDQPYGVGPEHKKYKVPTVGDRMEISSGSAANGGN